jgi:hypothetical protein
MMGTTTTWRWGLQLCDDEDYIFKRASTTITWWQELQDDAGDYNMMDYYSEEKMYQGTTGKWWPGQFISLKDISNPSLHLKQQQDEGQF